ncbi:MAG TPA: hypothetical protein VMZ30_16550 [Pyrinomonadaceae bacterium]|nr:hypothetical protein [Pyrinomonadaceae bacterium]
MYELYLGLCHAHGNDHGLPGPAALQNRKLFLRTAFLLQLYAWSHPQSRGRHGMAYEEEDWVVDHDTTAHHDPNE